MNDRDDLEPGEALPAEPASGLAAALLRIGSSLDLDTVLKEVVECARALTGARYGAIVTINDAGEPRDFVTSGFTEEQHRSMAEWPEGRALFEHFRNLGRTLRIDDVPGHVCTLGFSPDRLPWGTLQGTPMRHRGVHVGNFYLVEKEGGAPFTNRDEEVLLLFAAQAAAAIAHARAYREERRARADLEALIETSPFGVAVFDGATGRPLSINREARRIVEGLHEPGSGTENLLRTVTCRRADGREFALCGLPLTAALSSGETVRAEEIELSTPDGRRVTTLINATPIRADDGAVASIVVTLQDLAPLEKLERMRAEFLGMVSHELRAPLTSIKVSAATLMKITPEMHGPEIHQYLRIITEQADRMRALIDDLLDADRIETGTLSVAPEPSEILSMVDRARTTFLSGGARHRIVLDLPPDLPQVMADQERIVQVLSNLLANAERHSPETAPIRIEAARESVHVAVAVADEGRGLAPDRLAQLFRKHNADGGLGLAICKGLVEAHGGRIRAESAGPGRVRASPSPSRRSTRPTRTRPIRRRAGRDATPAGVDPSPPASSSSTTTRRRSD